MELVQSIIENDIKRARKYIESVEDINVVHDGLSNPLYISIEMGRTHIVRMLLKSGIHENVVDMNDMTPLIFACYCKRRSIANILLARDTVANINECDINGWTVLHYASRNKWNTFVSKLIEQGIDINIETSFGHKAIDLVEHDKTKIILEKHSLLNGIYSDISDLNLAIRDIELFLK
jgi:ankyrin repeat protein